MRKVETRQLLDMKLQDFPLILLSHFFPFTLWHMAVD